MQYLHSHLLFLFLALARLDFSFGPDCTSEQSITMWSSDRIRARAGLSREEKDQKEEKTVSTLALTLTRAPTCV